MPPILPLVIVALAGTALALQAPLNAALGRAVGSATAAGAISFGVGFAVLVAVTLVRGDGAAFAKLPAVEWRLLAGGFLGAFYVWAVLWSVPTLGVVTAFAALILGQLGMALLLDATGTFGLAVQSVSPARLVAIALVAGGLILSRF